MVLLAHPSRSLPQLPHPGARNLRAGLRRGVDAPGRCEAGAGGGEGKGRGGRGGRRWSPVRGRGFGQTDPRRAKQKQLLVIGAAGEGAGFPVPVARGCGGRAEGQSHRWQERTAAEAPAPPAGLEADLLHLAGGPSVPEGFPDTPSSPGRGRKPLTPHLLLLPPQRALSFSLLAPQEWCLDGRYSKPAKEVGPRPATEVPSPPPPTPSILAEVAKHFPLF